MKLPQKEQPSIEMLTNYDKYTGVKVDQSIHLVRTSIIEAFVPSWHKSQFLQQKIKLNRAKILERTENRKPMCIGIRSKS